MSPRDENQRLQREISDLRSRINRLEADHRESLARLRLDLSALEATALSFESPPPPEPPPLPPRTIESSAPTPPPAPAPEPPPPPPPVAETPFELRFGRVWLVRIGIVLLLTGLVLLGNFAYRNWIRELPAGIRLAGLTSLALILLETGRRLARSATLAAFGEVVLAGGLAFLYYCSFAAHHVQRLKVIDNPVAAAILLLASASLIGAVSWIRQAKATAILGLLLASYSTILQPIGWLSCLSNILLASAGLLFMLRPGWSAPGVASMVGTYVSFAGWQFLGAAQGKPDNLAALWFLPPAWLLFSLPGLLDRFRPSMSDRGRAFFTGWNNGLFFLLFSALWIDHMGASGYWLVAALFGAILILFGAIGRKSSQIAGGVNLTQGLALVSLAIVLKLRGYHLTLALAAESLALALAFFKFKGRSELAFSLLSAFLAAAWICLDDRLSSGVIPLWSQWLVAALIAAASIVLRRSDGPRSRTACTIAFFLAVAAAIGCCFHLSLPWRLPVAIALSVSLSAIACRVDRRFWLSEIGPASFVFLLCGFYFLFTAHPSPALALPAILSIAGCWLWHRQDERPEAESINEPDLKIPSFIPAWAYSLFVSAVAWRLVDSTPYPPDTKLIILGAAAVLLTAISRLLRCHRLSLAAVPLIGIALTRGLATPPLPAFVPFALAGMAAACIAILALPPNAPVGKNRETRFALIISRFIAFASFCFGCYLFSPVFWPDLLALAAILLAAIPLVLKRPLLPESIALLAIAIGRLISTMASSPWSTHSNPTWRGALAAAASLALTSTPIGRRHPIALSASILASAWATQMLVWRAGWPSATVLWAVLGFVAVTAGLWRKQLAFRQAGFALLALSLVKIFAVDVWDFNTFTRIISFTVLGLALILLGLFYNRFAPALKRLLEDNEPR